MRRWLKGNLHCHSYWSDGRAFPDQAICDYRDETAPYYAAGNTAALHPKVATAWTQPFVG